MSGRRPLAQVAYEAYSARAGGVSLVSGEPLPGWDTLPEVIQDAWGSAQAAVLAEHAATWGQGTETR